MHVSAVLRRATTVAIIALAVLVLTAGSALAMSRSLVMDRAQRWVDLSIEYSMVGWANEVGEIVDSPTLGWRRDCSGFASMTWNLPVPGASSRTIHNYATLITKEALQPGDAMVSYDNHVAIFGGWVDDRRIAYYAYEMSSSQSDATGDGTVMRITPYPYWNLADTYQPYRLNGITENIDYSVCTTPVAGTSRYDTALEASRMAFPDGGASVVIVASGANWPDALGAAALAGAAGGPILLTGPESVPTGLTEEIARLGAGEVIIVGGEGAVSAGVFDALAMLPGVQVTRIGGSSRYDTARLIAAETVRRSEDASETFDGTAFIATGVNFPDALAASAFAADAARPILLTAPDALSAEASQGVSDLGVTRALVLGSEGALSSQVASDLASTLGEENVVRLGGSSRYVTASKIVEFCLPESSLGHAGLAIASGQGFPDALAGGVMAARMGTFLSLTPTAYLNPDLARWLIDNREDVGSAHVLGGEGVIPPIVRESIALALCEE